MRKSKTLAVWSRDEVASRLLLTREKRVVVTIEDGNEGCHGAVCQENGIGARAVANLESLIHLYHVPPHGVA